MLFLIKLLPDYTLFDLGSCYTIFD